jgi:hypothetical protein
MMKSRSIQIPGQRLASVPFAVQAACTSLRFAENGGSSIYQVAVRGQKIAAGTAWKGFR